MIVVVAVRELVAGVLGLVATVAGTVLHVCVERVTSVATAAVPGRGTAGLLEGVVEAAALSVVGLAGLAITRRTGRAPGPAGMSSARVTSH